MAGRLACKLSYAATRRQFTWVLRGPSHLICRYDEKMTQPLHYPELSPPQDWTGAHHATQIQLLPPGERAEAPQAAVYVSPLIARHANLPSAERLIAQAIEAEAQKRIKLTDFREPVPFVADSGLSGICVEIACLVVPTQARERRQYIMLTDALCYYGISYLAAPEVFERYLPQFHAVARSIRPFKGRAITGAAAAAAVIKQYND